MRPSAEAARARARAHASAGLLLSLARRTDPPPFLSLSLPLPAPAPSYARAKGVAKMTFDNADELRKIAREHPGAQVVLRILTDDSASVCRLGLKFGAPLSAVRGLLLEARALKLDVLGVS